MPMIPTIGAMTIAISVAMLRRFHRVPGRR
jgi:hypothetical protein